MGIANVDPSPATPGRRHTWSGGACRAGTVGRTMGRPERRGAAPMAEESRQGDQGGGGSGGAEAGATVADEGITRMGTAPGGGATGAPAGVAAAVVRPAARGAT